MDNIRLFLIAALMFLGLLLYQAWQKDYPTTPPPAQSIAESSGGADAQLPVVENDAELPETVSEEGGATSLPSAEKTTTKDAYVIVKTDVLHVAINTRGGDIRRLELPGYPVDIKQPDTPFRLMNDGPGPLFVVQSGLLSKEKDQAPTHQSLYRAEQNNYELLQGKDELEVKLRWSGVNDLKVAKIYTFKRGAYSVDIRYHIENAGTVDWQGRMYSQLQRNNNTGVEQSKLLYTYLGGAVATPASRYDKIDFDEIEGNATAEEWKNPWSGGWLAMLQHYFVAAVVPEETQTYHYYSKFLPQGQRYVLGLYGPGASLAPGESRDFSFQLYAGPKLQHRLGELSPGLELTVDYGWLWFLAQPLFWLLEKLYVLFGNWGWAIIAVTIIIKGAFFQLSATSYKSMANMRRIHPRLLALKERYGNDRQALNQAMMDLYRKEKINPLGGCLPILIQIPVFIALYWVLLESVELRQAAFIGWIQDMSKPDPYFILPLIMGITMFLQQKLNPTPLDPVQAKVMMILPIVFTVFFAFFPSGLVLYWTANNILSILQQWYITKKITEDSK